jgi:hypothetical protein
MIDRPVVNPSEKRSARERNQRQRKGIFERRESPRPLWDEGSAPIHLGLLAARRITTAASVHSALVHPRPGREVGTGEVTPQARRTYITLSLGDLLEHARRTCGAAQEMLAALVDRGMPPDALNEWRSLDREAIEDAIKFLAQVTPASPTGARPQTVSIQSPLGGGQ